MGHTEQQESAANGGPSGASEIRFQLRGSSLLLVGRVIAVGLNFLTQVLIARYLPTTEYGAFTYALSIVALVGGFVGLGSDRAISRFLPIYDESSDTPRFFGTLALVVALVLGVGATVALVILGLQSSLVFGVVPDRLTMSVVALMIFLAPIEALDGVLTDTFAVFRSTKAIFVRKYILAPSFRVAVVLLLILNDADVHFLAGGYLATGLAGVLLYISLLPALFERARLTWRGTSFRLRVPLREIAAYTTPLLTIDVLLLSMSSLDAILVGQMHGIDEVARLKVVESTAKLNAIVFSTFTILLTPAIARLFARQDREQLRDLYWRTAAWIAVASFPIFVATFSLATPVTVLLFGERYRSSGLILAALALARYVDAAFGANGQTIRMFGGVREIVVVNLLTAGLHLGLALLLIPVYGAMGAAIAILISFVIYNVLKQVALRRVTGIPMFERAYLRVYGLVAVVTGAVAALELSVNPPLPVAIPLAIVAIAIVFLSARRALRIADIFPEIGRLPGFRHLR